MSTNLPTEDAPTIAARVASALAGKGVETAIGGAIALGFWAEPRGTLDVDITLFLPPEDTDRCCDLLIEVGCEFDWVEAVTSLREHGYAPVRHSGLRLDVFLPLIDFYGAARERRRSVPLAGAEVSIWDAETLCVFKMMFFREKDIADIGSMLRHSDPSFDSEWVERSLEQIFGARDPRVSRWREIVEAQDASEAPPSGPA